ncbi:MAG: insulinase family protein [Chlorobi bacterium]|nr:insulinase family protein [Chlorobiota bacterium]MCI0717194.1 insulinase family protein [Chlorobiota bacterium]
MANTLVAQDEKLDRTKPPKPGPPKDVLFPDYFDTTLPNGINVLVIENSKIPAVSVRLVFKDAGSYYDGGKFGLASLTAELLTKGTKNRSATQIAEEIDFLGGSINSGSDWDGSYVSLSLLKKHLDKGIGILADVVLNPTFVEDEIARVKEQRISSILQSKDDAGNLSEKKFYKVLFDQHPYAYPSEGTEESVKILSKADFESFYNNHYGPENLILAFVGDITKEEAINFVNTQFSNWNKSSSENRDIKLYLIDDTKPSSVYIVNKPGAVQSSLRIGHIGISRNNPDFIAVTVMNTLLGGYFGSRINYNLREKHGFTYGARSNFNPRIYPGDFSVDADVRNEVTDTSITLIIGELKKIISEEVSDDELETVKNYLTGVFPLQLETANAVASRVINLKLYNLPKDYYSKYISTINSLTKQDILKAAKKYIRPDNLFIVASGDADAIKDKLKKFGDVEVFDADDKVLDPPLEKGE